MRGLKKASNILFTISQVLSFIFAFLYLALAVVFIIFSTPLCKEIISTGIQDGAITVGFPADSVDEAVMIVQATFLALGIVFAFMMIFAIINGVIVGVTKKKDSKALYIVNIIFGLISGVELNLIAGIFGLISCGKVE